MAAVRLRERRVRRWWYLGITMTAFVLFAVFWVTASSADLAGGCDFAPSGSTPSCLTPLTGSTFAGGDGNLLTNPTTFGPTDWQNVSGLNADFDLPSGSNDNSFGQGAKEDNPVINVVAGSIPPNKSDLTRFYEASSFSSQNNHNFLYLGWERTNVLGTANFDFEINQAAQPDLTTTGTKTLNRTPGDLLVTYDFSNGGGRPTIGLLRWLTSATVPAVTGFPTNVCFSANTFPCWGDQVTLDGTDSVAAVNNLDPVSDPLFPNSANQCGAAAKPPTPGTCPALTFGEVAIDLTKADVFPSGTCTAFGSAFVRSRSSTSFTAEIKDFIAPIPVNISNCGTVNIIKHSDPRGVNQDFGYTSTIPNPAAGSSTPSCSLDATPSAFTLNDHAGVDPNPITGTDNTEHCVNVPAGSYTVTEGAEPGGFTFTGLSCTASGTSSGSQDGSNPQQANITINPGDTVTCTYTNQQNTASMVTQVSNAGPVFPGTAVHDTATVTGNQPADTPSGTVTFFMCGPTAADAGCSTGGTNVGTGSLSGSGATASANSPDVNTAASPLTPGHYCFRAEWPGDANYPTALSHFGGTNGTNECFTVQTIATTTTTTPSVGSNGTATFGQSVTDHAVVQAVQSGDGTPTGTVTFFVCNPSQTTGGACPTGGSQVGSPVTTQAVNGSSPPASSADSVAVTANQTGTWCFRAVYTPGGANGANYTGSSDASIGECFTVTDTTSSASAQTWLPNDTATVTAGAGAPLNGTLSIQLYTDGTCGSSGGSAVSGQLYSKTLTNATTVAARTLTTSNTTFTVSTSTAVSWFVLFTSSDPNVPGSGHCESTSLTITN